jgi:hypothetical protein
MNAPKTKRPAKSAKPAPRCQCGKRLLRYSKTEYVCERCTGWWPVRGLPTSNAKAA